MIDDRSGNRRGWPAVKRSTHSAIRCHGVLCSVPYALTDCDMDGRVICVCAATNTRSAKRIIVLRNLAIRWRALVCTEIKKLCDFVMEFFMLSCN